MNNNNKNNLYKKPTIHFILPAGGMKGCFQFGFLYRLKKRYSHLYDLYQIEGTSVGALNGYAYIKNKLDYIKEIWLNIKGRDDFFSSLSKVPLFNYLVTGYNAIFGYGIYSNHKLESLIKMEGYNDKYDANSEDVEDSDKCDDVEDIFKYNCAVMNINLGETEYINGGNDNIEKFVLASSSPWIISRPTLINNSYYTDGALLETYPLKYVKESKADYIIVVGYDPTHDHISNGLGENMLEYLAHLIDILRYKRHQNTKKMFYELKDRMLLIPNTICCTDILNLSQEVIHQGFKDGEYAADRFVIEHLPIPGEKNVNPLWRTKLNSKTTEELISLSEPKQIEIKDLEELDFEFYEEDLEDLEDLNINLHKDIDKPNIVLKDLETITNKLIDIEKDIKQCSTKPIDIKNSKKTKKNISRSKSATSLTQLTNSMKIKKLDI